MSEPVSGLVGRAELVRLRGEVREGGNHVPPLDLPPGEDEPLDHIVRIYVQIIILVFNLK